MIKPDPYAAIKNAFNDLSPEIMEKIQPAIEKGNPNAFIAVLKKAHRQIGEFLARYEEGLRKAEEKNDPSIDPGPGGEQGDTGKE